MNAAQTKQRWYSTLVDRFYSLSRKYDLPQDIADDFLGFIVEVAKDQFKAGNRSGIAWARSTPSSMPTG